MGEVSLLADLEVLEASLGITFKDRTLLQQALVHRSYLHENPDLALSSNERLEFLGDALLGFVVAERLYLEFPDTQEGGLTRLRSALVCREALYRIALSLDLGDYIYLGSGEESSGGRRRRKTLACALEALVGAVLVDMGFDVAKGLVMNLISAEYERVREGKLDTDHKSKLQEIIQSQHKSPPVYRVVAVEGPDHVRSFTVEVMAEETVLGRGTGRSKRAAQKEAAKEALKEIMQD
ncbi:ribonuclease III [Chloroflexota bacterium]